ncbi:MAG: CpXC domain-containing protein [Pseudorhodobacter sp.]
MSLFHPVNLVCPTCGTVMTMPAVGSVNADRRPDLRLAILEDRFQDVACTACAGRFRLQPEFNFLDTGRGQWIAAMPAARMPDWVAVEDEINAVWEASYGAAAPAMAREIGTGLRVRLTFGWPGLREKIVAREAGLDDAVLEILKLDMLRNMAETRLGPGIELRLVRDLGTDLAFAWIASTSEGAAGSQFLVARYAYDAIAGNPAPWAALRAELEEGPFVDLQKLYAGRGRNADPDPEPDVDAILAEAAEE